MRISVDVQSAGVQRTLGALGDRARNLRPAFAAIGEDIIATALLGFKDSKDPYGALWRPLKPATIAKRRKGKGAGSAKPLLDTGRLRNSITKRLRGNSGVEIGTNVVYAAIHQFGGQAGRGRKVNIPQRSFLATADRGLPREYAEIIRDRLAQHFGRVAP